MNENAESESADRAKVARSTGTRATGTRATKAAVEARIAAVRGWIGKEGLSAGEAVDRLQHAFGLGRRQALRYWVRAYAPLLDEGDRRRYARGPRPRGPRGRYRTWPSLQRAQEPARDDDRTAAEHEAVPAMRKNARGRQER